MSPTPAWLGAAVQSARASWTHTVSTGVASCVTFVLPTGGNWKARHSSTLSLLAQTSHAVLTPGARHEAVSRRAENGRGRAAHGQRSHCAPRRWIVQRDLKDHPVVCSPSSVSPGDPSSGAGVHCTHSVRVRVLQMTPQGSTRSTLSTRATRSCSTCPPCCRTPRRTSSRWVRARHAAAALTRA